MAFPVRRSHKCVAWLIRCLLGQDAVKSEKLKHGMPLVVLGLEVHAPPARFFPIAAQRAARRRLAV